MQIFRVWFILAGVAFIPCIVFAGTDPGGHGIIVMLPVIIVGVSAFVYLSYGVRCPNCRQRMGEILHFACPLFKGGKPSKLMYCPFCGIALDTEIVQQPSPRDSSKAADGLTGTHDS